MNKRTLQEIFDAVIDAGLYPGNKNNYLGSYFMCTAVRTAYNTDIINEDEANRAIKSIQTYLNKLSPGINTLVNAWKEAGIINYDYAAMEFLEKNSDRFVACYRDWTNRPYAHRALKRVK